MIEKYFPKCPIAGPILPPAPFGHGVSIGAVPNKCGSCSMLFEGECLRHPDRYMHLDHGPCPFPGVTSPIRYSFSCEDKHFSVQVPSKCITCAYLKNDSIYQAFCSHDSDVWGDFHRSLDWGEWEPDEVS